MLGLDILLGLSLVISFILLIIPGLFLLPRLILAPYFLVDQKLSISGALQPSWDQSKGHAGKAWGVIGVSILFGLLELVLIGFYFSFIYGAAFALLYTFVIARHAATAGQAQAPAAPAVAPQAPTGRLRRVFCPLYTCKNRGNLLK